MAYKKRTYRKRTFKRKGAASAGGGVMATAMKALSIANGLKALVNVERKYFDLNVTALSSDWNMSGQVMHAIPQGTTAFTRNGDSIKASSFQLKYSIYSNAVGSTHPVRVMVIRGRSERGTTPTAAMVLSQTSNINVINSARQPDGDNNFKVLHDVVHICSALDRSAMSAHKYFVKLDDHIHYQTSITTTESGGIFVFFFTDVTGATAPIINYSSRIRFIDN